VERELADGRVVVLDVESFPIRRQWFMVHRSGKRLSRVGKAFEDFVRTEAGRFVSLIRIPKEESTFGENTLSMAVD
jgi:DNA-binding transcriptional LysR family regulator